MEPRKLLLLAGLLAALPAVGADYTGFWKPRCTDEFGVQIKRLPSGLYSLSFCGPGPTGAGSCFAGWKPDSAIEGDPNYKVVDEKTIELVGGRNSRFVKCSDDPNGRLAGAAKPAAAPPERRVRVFQPNLGLPNYQFQTPFVGGISQALRDSIAQTTASAQSCNVGSVSVPGLPDVPLSSNICDKERFEWIRALLTRVAPPLKRQNLTFSKISLSSSREALLVGHIDISNDEPFRYPYLSLWLLEAREPSSPVYGGTYLAGEVHAVRPFGAQGAEPVVFVKYLTLHRMQSPRLPRLHPVHTTGRRQPLSIHLYYGRSRGRRGQDGVRTAGQGPLPRGKGGVADSGSARREGAASLPAFRFHGWLPGRVVGLHVPRPEVQSQPARGPVARRISQVLERGQQAVTTPEVRPWKR